MTSPTGQDELPPRDREILRAIVQDFITTGEPVGSQAVAPRADVSPATVRSVMADLEALGYLEKPHTSAGRVPTEKGLRLYVDALLRIRAPHPRERERIERGLHPAPVEDLIAGASRILHELTHHAAVVLAPDLEQTVIRRIEFVRLREDRVLAILVTPSGVVQNRLITVDFPISREELEHATNYLQELIAGELTIEQVQQKLREELDADRALYDALVKKSLELGARAVEGGSGPPRVVIEGEASFLDQPEFTEDVTRMRSLFAELVRKDRLLEVLRRAVHGKEIRIFIGTESEFSASAGVSVITAPYGREEGLLGALAVIGPTRMNYGKVIPLVEYTARAVSRSLVDP